MKKAACFSFILLVLNVCAFNATEFPVKNTGALILKIKPMFNGKPLRLLKELYITANGDTVYIDVFKFYVSAFTLTELSGKKITLPNSSYLINAEDTASLYIRLKGLNANVFKNISFTLGLDSLTNVSGALDGDLDPVKGMYWAWNTGYINAKLEGHSPACKTVHHAFEFHIGGYLPPYKTMRPVSIPLPGLNVVANKTTVLELNADVGQWFNGPVTIDVSKINSVVLPNVNAMILADNYKDMFTIAAFQNP